MQSLISDAVDDSPVLTGVREIEAVTTTELELPGA
jgi:hypothetical protein